MVLEKSDKVILSSALYNDLQSSMGPQSFDLYQRTTNVFPHQQREQSSSTTTKQAHKQRPPKYTPSFPPLLSTFTLRQSKQTVRQTTRPIVMTAELRAELVNTLGEANVKLLESSIGFQDRGRLPPAPGATATSGDDTTANLNNTNVTVGGTMGGGHGGGGGGSGNVYANVWGERPRPNYQFSTQPHFAKINNKFFWPNMTNPLCEIPIQMSLPTNVRDLGSWLKTYGEPDVNRIPTGSVTTFKSNGRRFGKDKSRGVEMVQTATGAEWKKVFDAKREEVRLQNQGGSDGRGY